MNVADLQAQVWDLLDDDGTYYPAGNVLDALNEAQRFFCLLTLCLEETANFPLTAGQAFYHVRQTLPDWLVPRRIRNSYGWRLRPCRLHELDAVNDSWEATLGSPQRYALSGIDLLSIYPQPAAADTLTMIYARGPAALVNQTDTPEIQENSHFALANYAAYALRQPEGGQELGKFLGYFNDFLDEAQRVQTLMQAKNRDADYETTPFELALVDRSSLLRAK